MIVWAQDELRFVQFEVIKEFRSFETTVLKDGKKASVYDIYADDIFLGGVETEVEAKRILAKIVANYRNYQNEVNPW